MRLVLSTDNEHKIVEMKEVLAGLPIEILSKSDIGLGNVEVEESEETLEGNAKLKAIVMAEKVDDYILADDTGLFVEALQGEPGVHSARYASEHNDEANRQKLLEKLKNEKNRKAYFQTQLILIDPNKIIIPIDGICEGEIAFEKRGDEGFGYDCIFIPQGYQQTFGEMTLEEKNEISHRARALKKLKRYFENLL